MRDTDEKTRAANRAAIMEQSRANDEQVTRRMDHDQSVKDTAYRGHKNAQPEGLTLEQAEANLRAAGDGAESRHALREYFKARAKARS